MAAGISKHKRRSERALRKLQSMDEHLTRARDINREISRQLKPLERQVDRARKYKDLSARANELTQILAVDELRLTRARDINREISRQLKPLERQVDRARKYKDLSTRANELTQILAVDELRQLQAQWVDLESASRESAAALELARYRLSEKERELEKLQVMLEEKGLFVGDLGEQRRHMQDVVGRIGSDMRLLEEKGRNMVARLSEMRGTLSASEHQRKRTLEELSDINRQLDEERAAAEVAGVDVSSLEPAADELHARRVELDELISTLTRSVRDAQRNADNAALELVKVRETLSNAEIEDGMYAKRLEQVDDEADELRASLEHRRDRSVELEAELEDARKGRQEAKDALDVAISALAQLREQEGNARTKLADVRSELSGLRKLDASLADSSPLAACVVSNRPQAIAARLGDLIEAPRELEGLVEQLLAEDIDALVCMDSAALASAALFALSMDDASGETLMVSRDIAPASASEHQRKRTLEELSDINRQLDEERAAAEVAGVDVSSLEPAADELHARRVELDELISTLTRSVRDAQRNADNAALELVKVRETLSNAEIEDGMYAKRLEQVDDEADELRASLEHRRDRSVELEAELEDARKGRQEAKDALDVAISALAQLREQEGNARTKLADVRSELSGLRKLDASLADSSPLAACVVSNRPQAIAARLGDLIEAPRELEGLVEQLLAEDIDALVCMDSAALASAALFALSMDDASGETLMVSRDIAPAAGLPEAAGRRLVELLQVRDGYAPVVCALLGGIYLVDSLEEALQAPVCPGVLYVTSDGARVRDGGVVRVGRSSRCSPGAGLPGCFVCHVRRCSRPRWRRRARRPFFRRGFRRTRA